MVAVYVSEQILQGKYILRSPFYFLKLCKKKKKTQEASENNSTDCDTMSAKHARKLQSERKENLFVSVDVNTE